MEGVGGDGPDEAVAVGEGEAVDEAAVLLLYEGDVGIFAGKLSGAYQYAVAGLETALFLFHNHIGLGVDVSDGGLQRADLFVGDHGVRGAGCAAEAVAPGEVANGAEDRGDLGGAAHEEHQARDGGTVVEDDLAPGAAGYLHDGIIYVGEALHLVLGPDALHHALIGHARTEPHGVPLHGVVDDDVAHMAEEPVAFFFVNGVAGLH